MLKELVLSADALWDAEEILGAKPTTKILAEGLCQIETIFNNAMFRK